MRLGPGSSPKNIHNTSLSSSAGKSPYRWEMVTSGWAQDDPVTSPPTSQKKVTHHTALTPNFVYKTFLQKMDFLSIICPKELIPFRAPQASVCPISLIIRYNLHSASMTFPEFQWDRYKQMLIREGRARETREKQSRAALGKVLFPHLRIHTTMSLSYGMLPTSKQTPDQLDLQFDDADSYLPHHQPFRIISTEWPYLNIYYKTYYLPQVRIHCFKGRSPLSPRLCLTKH